MPVDIYNLTEGWLELESDPGLFTLLLEDFGVKGVQVEEIYDLQKSLEGPVYGFIFLFRWIEERRSRRKIVDQIETFVKDEDTVNNIFFAQQMVPNSCATHALLSVLLNCPNIHLGNTLSRLKAHTTGMNPENKGWAIGNTPELAKAHNSHAMPQAKRRLDKSSGVTTGRFTGEAFHFVSYVPINGQLFELDGLKPFPMDHGPWAEKEDWTEKFRRVIIDRLGIATGEQYHDIRFNLMAVVPDTRLALTHKLKMLKTNRQIVLEALQQLIKLSHQDITNNKGMSELNEIHISNSSSDSPSKNEKVLQNGNYQIALKPGKNSISSEHLKNVSLDGFDYLNSPVILETHNYAKLLHSDLNKVNEENYILFKGDTEKLKSLSTLDYSTPLTIQTSPAPSSSSTDTSSEVGSAFNSPTQGWGWNSGQSSPLSTKDFKKFVVIRVAGTNEDKVESPTAARQLSSTSKRILGDVPFPNKKICLDSNSKTLSKDFEKPSNIREKSFNKEDFNLNEEKQKINKKLCSKYPELFEPHTFAPKDLLALLKNLENEINHCEMNLRDENEKRKKYKIDDCRRTHNYDEFICTFLSMLAQQGKLADLVEQHFILHKKPGAPIIRTQRSSKKNDSKSCTARRRKGKNKYKKRK